MLGDGCEKEDVYRYGSVSPERGRERPRGGVQAPHGKHARWQLYCGVARAQGQNTLRLRGDQRPR